jgi:UDPglucose 6-dehydrogenase
MNVTIIGTGYVGLVTGACLAEIGNHVVCLDLDEQKIRTFNHGGIPIYETGLSEIIRRNVDARRLTFSSDVAAGIVFGKVLVIAVGTPPDESGGADVRDVLAAAHSIGRHMTEFKVVVNKSTVPVGTAHRIDEVIGLALKERRLPELGYSVISNPEFLKEGEAVNDFMHPDRIVIGVAADAQGQRALGLVRQLYAPFNENHDHLLVMDVRSAELTKYAANAMLATRISFMNDLANLADKVGADIEQVRRGIGSDTRIGHSYLQAGAGYGGGCFPKDVRALARSGREHGQVLRVLEAVDAVNNDQKHVLVNKVMDCFGKDLHGKCFALWGLAFKPETSDLREAPSRQVIRALLHCGASVRAHDPVAMEEAERVLALDLADTPGLMARLCYAASPMEALRDADALIILTEWAVYRSIDLSALKSALRSALIIDGRNLYDPQQLFDAGVRYIGIGRSNSDA